MKRWTLVFSICALVVSLAVAVPSAMAYSVVIGAPGSGQNVFPFGYSGTRYQQVYNAALFTGGPMSITDISFYGGTSVNSADYAFHLSTTPKAVGGLNTSDLSDNVGSNDQVFFSGHLGGSVSGTWTIAGSAFTYNPSGGNLLLDIFISNSAGGGYAFDARNGDFGTDSSRAYNNGGGTTGFGLVTGFNAAPVPIPGAILLFAPGLAGLGVLKRRFTK